MEIFLLLKKRKCEFIFGDGEGKRKSERRWSFSV